jgi:hypothetical protein
MLVYEYAQNGSLAEALWGKPRNQLSLLTHLWQEVFFSSSVLSVMRRVERPTAIHSRFCLQLTAHLSDTRDGKQMIIESSIYMSGL